MFRGENEEGEEDFRWFGRKCGGVTASYVYFKITDGVVE